MLDLHRSVAVVNIVLLLLAAVLAPLWINSERIDKTTIRPSDVQAVAEHWASEAGWSVIGVTAAGDRMLVDLTGPNPAPDLAMLRQNLEAASLSGLDVWISLVTVSYQPLPKEPSRGPLAAPDDPVVRLGKTGLSGAIPLVSWLTVGPGAGLGGPGIRRGVVAVRCPACMAEQRPEGQQDHGSHRHPDTSSGQDVQGIVHPQIGPRPAHQAGVGDPRCGQRPDQERHERDDYRLSINPTEKTKLPSILSGTCGAKTLAIPPRAR